MIRAFACAWLCGVIFSANATEQTYAGHPAAMAFAARWAAANGEPSERIQAIIADAKRLDRVIKYVTPHPKASKRIGKPTGDALSSPNVFVPVSPSGRHTPLI